MKEVNPNNLPRLMNAKDAGDYLGLSPYTLKRLARTGQIPALLIGNSWKFSVPALDRWLLEMGSGE
ncbi:MAG: helix-turn-helix domain-containing protein [Ferrimicrobium sp.]